MRKVYTSHVKSKALRETQVIVMGLPGSHEQCWHSFSCGCHPAAC